MRPLLKLIVGLVACFGTVSHASVWEWVEVHQPLLLNGLESRPSPYLVRIWPYAQEVEMTCWENRLYSDGEWKDQNAASLFGIVVSLPWEGAAGATAEDFQGKGMHGDTLRVLVDVSAASVPSGWPDAMLRSVVALTIDCARRNAGFAYPTPRFVDVSVAGRPDLADLSGTTVVPAE
jgi:hypothetical protein